MLTPYRLPAYALAAWLGYTVASEVSAMLARVADAIKILP